MLCIPESFQSNVTEYRPDLLHEPNFSTHKSGVQSGLRTSAFEKSLSALMLLLINLDENSRLNKVHAVWQWAKVILIQGFESHCTMSSYVL